MTNLFQAQHAALFRTTPGVFDVICTSQFLALVYGKQNLRTWDDKTESSLLATVIMRVKNASLPIITHSPSSEYINDGGRTPQFSREQPGSLVQGYREITYICPKGERSKFVNEADECVLANPAAYLVELESLNHFPELRKYAPLIHYLFYRLQTWNTNLNHQPGWKKVFYPFDKARHIFNAEAFTLLYKPTQSIKTSMACAFAWVYAFVRGFHVVFFLRSIGVRYTGLVGLESKGIARMNETICQFILDISDQLESNGWNVGEAMSTFQLIVKSDQEVKWGEGKHSLKGTRVLDPRRDQQLERQALISATSPGMCTALPLNPTGVDFFFDFMCLVDRVDHMVPIIDECDEHVSSENRNKTSIEKKLYPRGVLPDMETKDKSQSRDVGPVDDDDDDSEDDYDSDSEEDVMDNAYGALLNSDERYEAEEEAYSDEEDDYERQLVEEEREASEARKALLTGTGLAAVKNVVGISATLLANFHTNSHLRCYVVTMDVAPNYIGFHTPDYCISRVQCIPIEHDQPSGRTLPEVINRAGVVESRSNTWWNGYPEVRERKTTVSLSLGYLICAI